MSLDCGHQQLRDSPVICTYRDGAHTHAAAGEATHYDTIHHTSQEVEAASSLPQSKGQTYHVTCVEAEPRSSGDAAGGWSWASNRGSLLGPHSSPPPGCPGGSTETLTDKQAQDKWVTMTVVMTPATSY